MVDNISSPFFRVSRQTGQVTVSRSFNEDDSLSKPVRCHLYCLQPGDTEDGKEEMEGLLKSLTADTVELHRRGAPHVLDGDEESLPVDLLLCRRNSSHPFLPEEKIKNSLVKCKTRILLYFTPVMVLILQNLKFPVDDGICNQS